MHIQFLELNSLLFHVNFTSHVLIIKSSQFLHQIRHLVLDRIEIRCQLTLLSLKLGISLFDVAGLRSVLVYASAYQSCDVDNFCLDFIDFDC